MELMTAGEETMIPIYTCEDEKETLKQIRQELQTAICIQNLDMEIKGAVQGPGELLEMLGDPPMRGIYFLDVDLKNREMDGFSLGLELRKRDPRGFLIYVTGYEKLAFQTFRLHLEALDYIVKGDVEELRQSLRQCLDAVEARLEAERGKTQPFFTVRAGDSCWHIPLESICFFETAPGTHRILLHGTEQRIDFLGSLSKLEKELSPAFVRTHRAYLVNREMIRKIDPKQRKLTMINGETCLLSRKYRKAMFEEEWE